MNRRMFLIVLLILLSLLNVNAQETVPGNIVDYQPASSKKYIGSPSLVILPNGDYVASHDIFGPNSSEWSQAETKIFISKNKGTTWKHVSTIHGAFWSSLFVHKGVLYLLGPDRHHGTVMIRKSEDAGKTWTTPTDKKNGVLLTGQFHCAPMPVIEYKGRLWRPMETAWGPTQVWGKRYGAMVMSASVDSDLLSAKSWQTSNSLLFDSTYLDGNFGGWLEGNFVVDKKGQMYDMLRVDDRSSYIEKAALVSISSDGKELSFNPKEDFIDFPGGSKKFTVKYDSESGHYWTLVNVIPKKYEGLHHDKRPSVYRNVLMLRKSEDLRKWEDVKVILEHPDVIKHGFQYVDWLFEGSNIIVLSRTAYFDGKNDASNAHNANFLTFHRIKNFRGL